MTDPQTSWFLGIIAWPLRALELLTSEDMANNNFVQTGSLAVWPLLMATRTIPVREGTIAYLGIGVGVTAMYGDYLTKKGDF